MNANKDIHGCLYGWLCKVLTDNEQYVYPDFYIDKKNTAIELDFEKKKKNRKNS